MKRPASACTAERRRTYERQVEDEDQTDHQTGDRWVPPPRPYYPPARRYERY